MLQKIISLWKSPKNKKGTTLHRRLILFFILVTISLVLVFTLLMSLFGITGRNGKAVENHIDTELSIIIDKINDDFGRISLGGITIAEEIAERSDDFFAKQGISASDFSAHPELIEPLLSEHIRTLITTVNDRYCGGAFIMLDATISTTAANAEQAKAGIFIKKTQPTATDSVGVQLHYLRGPASLARENDIMLLGQWKMEFEITDQDFFTKLMQTARENPELPLSRLYYWSGRVVLKGDSEAGFLLCVPLRAKDGTVFGLCGIQVSDRMFKSFYTPEGGDFENIFTVMSPECENGLCASRGLIAGNYYLTGNHWNFDLNVEDTHEGFVHYGGDAGSYGGKVASVRLYPNGSPFEGEQWQAAILMPKDILHNAVKGNVTYFTVIVIVLLAISVLASIFVSKHYLKPVNRAIESIKNNPHGALESDSRYVEISDLFEFLASKDQENEERLRRLHEEKTATEVHSERVQTHISHLTEERMPQVSNEEFEFFMQCLHTLTAKEREIFDLYLAGKKAKDIMEIANINQNTLKYHNRNIYSKLGISSRKQLLEYAVLMKYKKI